MSNVSFGFAGSGSNDASVGDVAWSNPSQATVSDELYASAYLTAQDSQYLFATDPSFDRSIPSTATITGVHIFINGNDSGASRDVTISECKLVKGGAVVGDSQSASEILGGIVGTALMNEAVYGGESNLWGTALTPTDVNAADFGVAIRVDAGANTRTARIDCVRFIVYWTDTISCVATAVSPTSGKQAPYAFHAHAFDSVWGTADPEDIAIKWTVTGPGGWSMTAVDPRPGEVSGEARDCATGIVGWNAGWLFDVAGSYTVKATMLTNDPSTNAVVRTVSNTINVTVDADSRTVKYLNSVTGADINDGSAGQPWATLNKSITEINAVGGDTKLIIADGHTETNPTAITMTTVSNVWITRNGGGTIPTINRTTSAQVVSIVSSTDVVVDGLRISTSGISATSRPNFVDNPANNTRLTITNCESNEVQSFTEWSSAGSSSQVLLLNNTADIVSRYFHYQGGNVSSVVCIGNVSTNNTTMTGEGHYRFSSSRIDTPRGGTLCWNSTASLSGYNASYQALRLFHSYMSCFQHSAVDQSIYLFQNVSSQTVAFNLVCRYDGLYADNCTMLSGISSGKMFSIQNSHLHGRGTVATLIHHGHALSMKWLMNLLIIGNTTGARTLGSQSGSADTRMNVTMIGNMFSPLAPHASQAWQGNHWSSNHSYAMVVESAFNAFCETRSGDIRFGWAEANVSYDTESDWNATAFAHDEVFSSSEQYADLSSAANWVTSSDIVDPDYVHGVYWDYRGVDRNLSAATWLTGMTGIETDYIAFLISVGSGTLVLRTAGV